MCGRTLGRFRRPEDNVDWLAPSNIFQKRGGGGALIWGFMRLIRVIR